MFLSFIIIFPLPRIFYRDKICDCVRGFDDNSLRLKPVILLVIIHTETPEHKIVNAHAESSTKWSNRWFAFLPFFPRTKTTSAKYIVYEDRPFIFCDCVFSCFHA